MRRKKYLQYSSFLLVILSLSLGTFLFIKKNYHTWEEKKILAQNIWKNQEYTSIPYIEIPSIGLTKIIKEDSSKETLDQYYVGIWNAEKNIQKVHHLILVGHNVQTVFGPLHRMKRGDLIYVYVKDQKYVYETSVVKEMRITETEYLEETAYSYLTLVTCTSNNQKRLLVSATRKEP